MPMLDIITIAQPSLLSYMRLPRVQISVNQRAVCGNFTHRDEYRLAYLWTSLKNPANANFGATPVNLNQAKFVIKAVSTLQPKRPVQNKDAEKDDVSDPLVPDSATQELNDESPSEDLEEIDEREKLRRQRISKANKGNTPWNKGRKHSPETLRRIKERTRLAMQNPKVKMKLANLGHAQSNETRKKIGIGVQMGWRRRREKLLLQETCYFNWQNLIAEAAKQGFTDEEELQWDSHEKLSKQLQVEWVESEEQRKTMSKPKGNKRAPKSLEQRRKIAASIAAKWADPEYRNRVFSGLAKYHGSPIGVERRRRKPTGEGQSRRTSPKKVAGDDTLGKASYRQPKPKKSKGPLYKDPLAKAKLEMIKNIRARRSSSDTKKNQALGRAKSLIAEAEKAAKALEVAATSSPIAQASLVETRRLIAEAVQLVQSIETEPSTSISDNKVLAPTEHGDEIEKQKGLVEEDQISLPHQIPLNGVHNIEKAKDEAIGFDFVKFPLNSSTNIRAEDDDRKPAVLDTYQMPNFDINNLVSEPNLREAKNGSAIKFNGKPESDANINGEGLKINGAREQGSVAVSRRWVRGRLVEVVGE